ncbi:MAG: hypothetical protein IKG94_04430, partial [Candidatus Methanomethylophilaceae archaeon]|nr:hypothetical protein [Candidatus Methanomethylophilaceae archaeon]
MGSDAEYRVCKEDSDSSDGLKKRTMDYWNDRARGYKELTRLCLKEEDYDVVRIIGRFINLNRQLKVADMGTGAGFFAI